MLLIADSGSTKTDWRLIINRKKIIQVNTVGYNPYFIHTHEVAQSLKKDLLPAIGGQSIDKIFFYGAGCSNKDNCAIISNAIKMVFPTALVFINHDMLAAARALCGQNAGVASILGTGSNACFYDGEKITKSIVSLGYILGDEGGGAHIGKLFIKKVLSKQINKSLSDKFYNRFELTDYEILNTIYKKPNPNRFLASFSPFLAENIHEKEVYLTIKDAFYGFFNHITNQISDFKQHNLYCVGSIAYFFKNILLEVANEKNIKIAKILNKPIEGLIQFHLSIEEDNED